MCRYVIFSLLGNYQVFSCVVEISQRLENVNYNHSEGIIKVYLPIYFVRKKQEKLGLIFDTRMICFFFYI